MEIRRVVTGYDPNGRPRILSDGPAPVVFSSPALPGYGITELCALSSVPSALDEVGTQSGEWRLEVPTGGIAWRIVVRPPESSWTGGADALLAEVGVGERDAGQDPGHAAAGHADDDAPRGRSTPGLHRTDTVDLILVLSGETWLEVGGQEVRLGPGDCVVQGGVEHAWSNRGDGPCVICAVMISARLPSTARSAAGQ